MPSPTTGPRPHTWLRRFVAAGRSHEEPRTLSWPRTARTKPRTSRARGLVVALVFASTLYVLELNFVSSRETTFASSFQSWTIADAPPREGGRRGEFLASGRANATDLEPGDGHGRATEARRSVRVDDVGSAASPGGATPRASQVIFHINYHKTGHVITVQYLKAVAAVKARTGGGLGGMIATDLNGKTREQMRAHDGATGCPLVLPPRTAPALYLKRMVAPDFFCDLAANDAFFERRGGGGRTKSAKAAGKQVAYDVKFIHMVRDPFGEYVAKGR